MWKCNFKIPQNTSLNKVSERERNPGKERNQLSVKKVNAESLRDERSAYKKK